MADVSERAYWHYEMQIKRLETHLGSMVGADGAIYAIRRSLWRQLPEDAINDFLNPLQIVAAGWRAVYEPEAVCHEETAGGIRAEYRRRVRIVSRSWRAVFQARPGAQPISSRPLLVVPALAQGPAMVLGGVPCPRPHRTHRSVRAARCRMVGRILNPDADCCRRSVPCNPNGSASYGDAIYFAVISAASAEGLVRGTFGRVSGVWTPPRAGRSVARPPADDGISGTPPAGHRARLAQLLWRRCFG